MPLRFVHVANLRLDAPLSPPCAVADDVRAILEEATATAFERTVTAAIEQNADALIITGNTFDASANSLAADVTLLRELASTTPACRCSSRRESSTLRRHGRKFLSCRQTSPCFSMAMKRAWS
jgi:hypothetical protein